MYPCPETPFSVEWDAFRDWHYFEIKWGTEPTDWNMQTNITGKDRTKVPSIWGLQLATAVGPTLSTNQHTIHL